MVQVGAQRVRLPVVKAIQTGAFASTAHVNPTVYESVKINGTKRKNVTVLPSTISQFLSSLSTIIIITKDCDFDNFHKDTSDWDIEDPNKFCEHLDKYHNEFQKLARFVSVQTLYSMDNHIRPQLLSDGLLWTSWSSSIMLDIQLILASSTISPPRCDNCHSCFCMTSNCPYYKVPSQTQRFSGGGSSKPGFKPPCRDFQRGSCSRGSSCSYFHKTSTPVKPRAAPSTPGSAPPRRTSPRSRAPNQP